jgi:hypothetical protein
MADKFKRHDRVVLAEDDKFHGCVYDLYPKDNYDDTTYYYIQWDKSGKYLYPEDMLLPEPKEKVKK